MYRDFHLSSWVNRHVLVTQGLVIGLQLQDGERCLSRSLWVNLVDFWNKFPTAPVPEVQHSQSIVTRSQSRIICFTGYYTLAEADLEQNMNRTFDRHCGVLKLSL